MRHMKKQMMRKPQKLERRKDNDQDERTTRKHGLGFDHRTTPEHHDEKSSFHNGLLHHGRLRLAWSAVIAAAQTSSVNRAVGVAAARVALVVAKPAVADIFARVANA